MLNTCICHNVYTIITILLLLFLSSLSFLSHLPHQLYTYLNTHMTYSSLISPFHPLLYRSASLPSLSHSPPSVIASLDLVFDPDIGFNETQYCTSMSHSLTCKHRHMSMHMSLYMYMHLFHRLCLHIHIIMYMHMDNHIPLHMFIYMISHIYISSSHLAVARLASFHQPFR